MPGRVVAVFPTSAYADVAGRLVSVETSEAQRLPCAVVLAETAADRPFADLRAGDPVLAGEGRLRLGPLHLTVARWWRPRVPRGSQAPRAATLPDRPDRPDRPDHLGWEALVLRLLGAGPGLTPAGDDVLAGLLVGLAGRTDLRDPLAAAVLRHASGRTTWLSAELLRLAARGEAAPPVVEVADALAGHGPVGALAAALPALLSLGHTSGRALAQGLLLAAETTAAHPLDVRAAA